MHSHMHMLKTFYHSTCCCSSHKIIYHVGTWQPQEYQWCHKYHSTVDYTNVLQHWATCASHVMQ